jgi:hypothetical protein
MSLYQKLEPLKLYALGAQSLVDAELQAYGSAFAELENEFERVHAQAFVQTSTGEGLSKHEQVVGLSSRSYLDDESRRALVLYRKSVAPFDYTLTGMQNSIGAAGMRADIIQNYDQESLTIVSHGLIDSFLALEDVKASLSKMLPAHLEIVLDMGSITWDMLELMVTDWNYWDSKDFTWEQFDIDMGDIFGKPKTT